eukprot:9313165-Pyramimonas_sp.AAC.1
MDSESSNLLTCNISSPPPPPPPPPHHPSSPSLLSSTSRCHCTQCNLTWTHPHNNSLISIRTHAKARSRSDLLALRLTHTGTHSCTGSLSFRLTQSQTHSH